MNLDPLNISRKTGDERFYSSTGNIDSRLLDFWQWSASDLLSNATRGRLAEYLVANDLGVTMYVRNEWDAYDLATKNGIKIEIKTSAYLQSWYQEKLSAISFDIKPTIKWNSTTNKFEGGPKRQSDFYVFCLLHHKNKMTVDPLNLDQWCFFVLPTEVLDRLLPHQKRISLDRLLKLGPMKCNYGQIKTEIERQTQFSI